MKATCITENLSKALGIVSKAVPIKAPLPILSNVLIVAENNVLKFAATNLETTIIIDVSASIEEEGSITVPAKILNEFISHLSAQNVEMRAENDVLHVNSGKAKSKFNGTSAEDFPSIPDFSEEAESIFIDSKVFSTAVSQVAFAASLDDSRPILGGVLLIVDGEDLTLVSTDGFRLSEKKINCQKTNKSVSMVVPAKTLAEVARIFGSVSENVELVLREDENLAVFKSDNVVIATRILAGEYPDYKRIIPEENSLVAEFVLDELVEAVKLTSIFAKEVDNVIYLTFDPQGHVSIVSESKETGENNSQFEADIEGEILKVAFSAKYLLDFLSSIKTSERIRFESSGSVAPGVLKPISETDYLHIIMPMRVQG